MNKLLSRYFEQNFFLIPIRQNDKRPVYRKWNQYSLSYNEARGFINGGFNLGVVAKDYIILDYDNYVTPYKYSENREEWLRYYRGFNTWIQFTPSHHWHIVLKGPLTGLPNYLYQHKLLEPDTIRHGDMYALVAPSKIDGHSYWWLDDCKGDVLKI